ncbi:hypothetical protein BH20VER3_BH20VER3_06550 [soil metagenome]
MKIPSFIRLPSLFIALGSVFLSATSSAAPGDLYVADSQGNQVLKFTPDGRKSVFVSAVEGPRDLAFDRAGNLFVVEGVSDTILKFTPEGVRSTFASGLNSAGSLAFDGAGNLFVVDSFGDIADIVKFTPAGGKSAFASGGYFSNLTFDTAGNLFTATGGPTNLTGGVVYITPDGTGHNFLFTGGPGLAVDTAGNIYVGSDDSILKFTPLPAREESVFVTGVNAVELAFDSAGNLFAVDYDSSSILKFAPDGTRSTFASGLTLPVYLAFEPVTEKLRNISARGLVGTGEGVLIGGFIVGGNGLANNAVAVRAIGPSLTLAGVTNALADPTLELHNASGALVASNDDWQDDQETEITASGLAPTDPNESAIFATLPAGGYTAVVRGAGDGTGVALVEVYSVTQ